MNKIEEKISKWEKLQFAYDTWFDTLDMKWKVGETIYKQNKLLFASIEDDLKELLPSESPQIVDKAAIEAKVKELAKLSTAPDKETPDWMESDIRKGIIAGIELASHQPDAVSREDGLDAEWIEQIEQVLEIKETNVELAHRQQLIGLLYSRYRRTASGGQK